jgi:rhodanese-related sulfurtransferase
MDVEKPIFVSPPQFTSPESLRVRPLLLKPQWMNGLSERLLVSHYENNYGGALRRLNAIRARLATLDWARTPVFEINGLKREELIAASSVILHEIYFDSLGGRGDKDDNRRPVLLDLCLPGDLPRRTDMLAGAIMHAPGALSRWIEELPRDRPIAVYCICGFQVSGTAVTELRQRGFNARALVGGITAWHAIGGTTVALDTSTYEERS